MSFRRLFSFNYGTSSSPLTTQVPAALGLGSGPLLIVLVIPRLVARHQAPTALGLHKSLEQAGAIIVQFLTSILLARGSEKLFAARAVVKFLLALVVVQLAVILVWWRVIERSTPPRPLPGYTAIVDDDDEEEEEEDFSETDSEVSSTELAEEPLDKTARRRLRQSKASFYACTVFIAASWVVSRSRSSPPSFRRA